MEDTYTSDLFRSVARELGITIVMEPDFGQTGEMIFPGGRRRLFKNCNPNINTSVSVEIARDKGYTHYFLRAKGIAVPRSAIFYAGDPGHNRLPVNAGGVGDAVRFAGSVGYPVFVKPNNLGEGRMVYKAHDEAELSTWAALILETNPVGIVEELCTGNDFRVVVLAGKVISAYQRLPLTVVGNGRDDIDTLLAGEKAAFPSYGRPASEITVEDTRIDACLARQGRNRTFVPAAGEQVRLLANANLSTGGKSVDITSALHPSFAELARNAADALGLCLAGVDILCDDAARPAGEQEWRVIEVNGEPDLDNYASTGEEQAVRLRALYAEILRFMAKEDPSGGT